MVQELVLAAQSQPEAAGLILRGIKGCGSPAFPETSEPGLTLQAWRKEVCSGSNEEVPDRAA
jgi:hypothetical protein